MSESASQVKEAALARLVEVATGLPAGPARDLFWSLAVATRVRVGDATAVSELMALDGSRRLATLELIAANQAATPALAEAARSVVWQHTTFATLSDRHLEMWAILSLDEARAADAVRAGRLEETNSADRIRLLGRLLSAGVPKSTAGVMALAGALAHEVEVDALLVGYLERQRVEAPEALFQRIRSPGARLEAMVAQALFGWRPERWEPVLAVAELALARLDDHAHNPGTPRRAGVNLASKAALIELSGGDARATWRAAIEDAAGETQPAMAARVHHAMLRAATCEAARWLEVVESIAASRVYLRDAESWLSVRAEVVRTMPMAARESTQLDRAHQAARELGARLPNRWFELFHYATVARELSRHGRPLEVVLEQLEAWVVREGLPRPVTQVSTEEVVAPLIEVDAGFAWRLGEALAKAPAQHMTWLAALALA